MRILILDDMPTRHMSFAQTYLGHKIVHVFRAAEAVEALDSEGRFDLVHLDHDLNDNRWVEEQNRWVEYTGFEVATYIAKMDPEKRPLNVIVHSWNAPRALRMVQMLQSLLPCFYQPFDCNNPPPH